MPSTRPSPGAHTPTGPGPVAAVHRVLIVAALVCALVYAGWEVSQWTHSSETMALVRSAVALIVAAGIALYLRSLRGLATKLTPGARDGR